VNIRKYSQNLENAISIFSFYDKMILESDNMDCLFCKIIDGVIPSKTIYEDDLVKVFLDINPNTNGHCLIIPKKHIVTVDELDSDLIAHILEVEKKMYKLLKEKLNIEGLTIVQNNELGQEVKHYHVHLIPRYHDDNWNLKFNQESLKQVEETYNKIMN
jgi:histidine triad (HIT) family protein